MLRAWCSLALLFLFATTSSALHFYLDLSEKRCFIEELPTDTVVEGCTLTSELCPPKLMKNIGHYRAQEWHEEEQQYKLNPSLGILINVDASVPCFFKETHLAKPHRRRWKRGLL